MFVTNLVHILCKFLCLATIIVHILVKFRTYIIVFRALFLKDGKSLKFTL